MRTVTGETQLYNFRAKKKKSICLFSQSLTKFTSEGLSASEEVYIYYLFSYVFVLFCV